MSQGVVKECVKLSLVFTISFKYDQHNKLRCITLQFDLKNLLTKNSQPLNGKTCHFSMSSSITLLNRTSFISKLKQLSQIPLNQIIYQRMQEKLATVVKIYRNRMIKRMSMVQRDRMNSKVNGIIEGCKVQWELMI